MRIPSSFLRGGLAGLAGGAAWFLGIALFFGPAQSVLSDPQLQSPKMLAVFTEDPLPRSAQAPWILPMGTLGIGVLWGWVYVWIAGAWRGRWWRRGLMFALLAWALMVPWFEFYLPWNVLLEPLPLALLEAACWAGVMMCVGLAIAGADAALGGHAPPTELT